MGAPLTGTKTFLRDLWGPVLKHSSVKDVARCQVVCKDAQRAGKQTIQDRKPQVIDNFPEAINTDSRPIADIIEHPNDKQKEYFDILHSLSLIEKRQASKDIREKLNDDKKEQVDEFLQDVAYTGGTPIDKTPIDETPIDETPIDETKHLCIAISCGADVNSTGSNGDTALHNAAKYGHKKIVQVLLEEENIDINYANIDGSTALHVAAELGCTETVKTLLKAGADINRVNNGASTALHAAACIGCTEVVKTLLKAGADINRVNNAGRTALQLAASRGHRDVVGIFKRDKLRKKLCAHVSRVMQSMCMMCIPK